MNEKNTEKKAAEELSTEELVKILEKRKEKENLEDAALSDMALRQKAKDRYEASLKLTTEEIKKIFEDRLESTKKGLIGLIIVTVFCTVLAFFCLFFIINKQLDSIEGATYGFGFAILVLIVCVFNLITDTKDIKTYKKAVLDPEAYRKLTIEEIPEYLKEDGVEYKHAAVRNNIFDRIKNKTKK